MQTSFETLVGHLRAALTNGIFQAAAKEKQMNVLPRSVSGLAQTSALYPIGKIDFNRPFVVKDLYGDEKAYPGEVLAVLNGADAPIIVKFTKDDGEEILRVDADGDSDDGDYEIEQVRTEPYQAFIVILRDFEGDITVVDNLYLSRDEVDNDVDLDQDDIILIQEITVPVNTAPVVVKPTNVVAAVITDDVADEEDGIVEAGLPGEPLMQLIINGVNRQVGDTVKTYRVGYGYRLAKIEKLRFSTSKQAFVLPEDGSKAYWAYDRNVFTAPVEIVRSVSTDREEIAPEVA